jgi:hypothetical protein
VPTANAQPAPPISEGIYTVTTYDGVVTPNVQIRYDCGPGCFSADGLDNPGPGTQYRFDQAGNRWQSPWLNYDAQCDGGEQAGQQRIFTVDGTQFREEYNITRDVCGSTAAQATAAANEQAQSGPPYRTYAPS